jgi:hypothetical protein
MCCTFSDQPPAFLIMAVDITANPAARFTKSIGKRRGQRLFVFPPLLTKAEENRTAYLMIPHHGAYGSALKMGG